MASNLIKLSGHPTPFGLITPPQEVRAEDAAVARGLNPR